MGILKGKEQGQALENSEHFSPSSGARRGWITFVDHRITISRASGSCHAGSLEEVDAVSFRRAWFIARFRVALCSTCWSVVLLASAVLAQGPSAVPAPADPAAPAAGAGKYESLPVVPWLSEDYFNKEKNDKRDKAKDNEFRVNAYEMKKAVEWLKKADRGDAINDQEKVQISGTEYSKAQIFDTYFSKFILAQMTQPDRVTQFATEIF